MASCTELSEQQKQKVNEALKDSLTSTTESWDIDMTIVEEGQKKVRLLGSQASTFSSKKKNETHIKGPVTIYVFDSTGTVKNKVYSDRAIYHADNSLFELFGNVRVNTTDDRHLRSDFLKWNQNTNMLDTPKFVIITTPQDSIAGTGFEGTADLTDYTIDEPTGRFIVN